MRVKRDTAEDELRYAAHDVFMAFWRGMNSAAAETLWLAYGAAQEQYEAYLMAARSQFGIFARWQLALDREVGLH